jgi:hypothetical protein
MAANLAREARRSAIGAPFGRVHRPKLFRPLYLDPVWRWLAPVYWESFSLIEAQLILAMLLRRSTIVAVLGSIAEPKLSATLKRGAGTGGAEQVLVDRSSKTWTTQFQLLISVTVQILMRQEHRS